MLAVNERIKTSIFLTILMILTPFAAATSITTFNDGSSEVIIQFKDGVNSVNTTEGGFYVPSDETITSASLEVSTNPLIIAGNTRTGIESGLPIWNPIINSLVVSYDNLSNFTYQSDDGTPVPLHFNSESYISDFEYNSSDFENVTALTPSHSVTGDPLAWQYGQKDSKTNLAGPNNCASGDMCWGTTFNDSDYTDDSTYTNNNDNSPFSFSLESPTIYLDPNLNDTYLRFSSWHSLRTNYLPNGDLTYSDCAFLRIKSSSDGNFGGIISQYLPFSLPYSSGLSAGNGFHLKYDSPPTAGQISNDCGGIASNNYGLAGTSTTSANTDGWAELAANLGLYSGTYVQIEFVLANSDTTQPSIFSNKAGWFIDDFQIGESYTDYGEMTVNNIQPSVSFDDKQPDGYGLLFIDSMTPGGSKLLVDVSDSLTSQIIVTSEGPLKDMDGTIIELWGIDVDLHSRISITFKFFSDNLGVSTPTLFGYNLGTRVGDSFSNPGLNRNMDIRNGQLYFDNDSSDVDNIIINIDDLVANNGDENPFSKPIYGLSYSIDSSCKTFNSSIYSKDLDETFNQTPRSDGNLNLTNDTINYFPIPIFDFVFTLTLLDICEINHIWIDLYFGHHPSSASIDFGNDGEIDWGFIEPGQGEFGKQNKFWSGEVDGVSGANNSEKLGLDAIAGIGVGGFFLLPLHSDIELFNVDIFDTTITSTNSTFAFQIQLFVGSSGCSFGTVQNNIGDLNLYDLKNYLICKEYLIDTITNESSPVFKTDNFGTEWVRIGFRIYQPDSDNGGLINLKNLQVIYNYKHTFNQSNGFDTYLREYVASESQTVQSGANVFIPLTTSSLKGGALKVSNLSIDTAPGYDSTLSWISDSEGLYPSGEIYEIVTTHEIQPSTGSLLSSARLRFVSDNGGLSFIYDPNTGFSEFDDSNNFLTLSSASTAIPFGSNGGKEITWRFTVNGEWNDTSKVSIFSESVATDGVVGMLGGIIIEPSIGNAVENDAGISTFELFNAANISQNKDLVYSNQFFRIVSEIRLQGIMMAPDPTSYYLLVEQRIIELDGQNTNISWSEVSNRSGAIDGNLDWLIDLGMFASGNETYRFRMAYYSNGDNICPGTEYQPDQDCSIQFNVTMDILDPNLLGIQLYKKPAGEGDPSLDENWRNLYDESWAVPRQSQNFRIIASDLPTPPETAVMHVWVEHDHDANSNGLAESTEYIQVQTTSNGQIPNATYTGSYNDYANSGLRGQVSLWVECYDLAGNPIDGGGPGLDNDIISYINMDLDYPSIKNMFIEDSSGERFINNLPINPPQGVGIWNQTMFAGNEYHLIVEAEDQNGWKDIEYIQIDLAPTESNYDSTVWYFPRNYTSWTESPYINILTNPDGSSKAKIRNGDGNVLIDPFESEFYLDLPITLDWGLPFSGQNTPTFIIKDLDNSEVFSESSFRQSWSYSDDIQLEVRGDLVNDLMISPIFYDLDAPYSKDVRKGSVYPGDSVSFTGQYTFTDGVISNVFVNPEIELVLEITRLPVEADFVKGYSKLDGEVTTHRFTGGIFNITVNAPGSVNEFDYTFRLIDLPTGAQDLTDSKCSGGTFYGCGSFSLKVDGTPPKVVQNSWSAERGEMADTDLERFLGSEMPTSTYHCVDVAVTIEEQGSLFEGDVHVKWQYFKDTNNALTWNFYQNTYGNEPLSHVLNLTTTGQGSTLAYADCIDLWPLVSGQFDVSSQDIGDDDVTLVMWIDAVDGSGSQVIFGGQPSQENGALGILSSDVKHASSYDFIFEKAQFQVRNVIVIPSEPEIGQSITIEIEVLNIGSLSGSANLSIRSVTNNGIPVLEGVVTSGEIGIDQSMWVTIELEEFRDATTGMYYIVDDNECLNNCVPLYDGKNNGDTFNVKVSSDSSSSSTTLLIVVLLIGVIGILAVVVVVLSRRKGSDDDYFEDEYGEDKTYAELPGQSTSAPAAYVSPEMIEAMESFPQWSQEDIQGYFDQGWDLASLQEWIDGQ